MKVRVEGLEGPNGLKALSADLDRAAQVSPIEVRKVVAKGALNIKKDWQARWSGHPKIKMLPGTVNYDTELTAGGATAEIGPDRSRRGAALANLIEYEFGGVHSSPIPGGAPALEAEKPRFEKALGDLEVRLLEGRR